MPERLLSKHWHLRDTDGTTTPNSPRRRGGAMPNGDDQGKAGLAMSVYLGIDGGGSKTTCVAADEVRVLGSAMAGGSNINRVGRTQARASIQKAIRQACAAADTEPSGVVRTCLGVAGFSNPEVAAAARQYITEVVA